MNKKNLKFKSRFFSIRVLIPLVLQSIAWPMMRLVFGIFTRFEVKGRENLKDIRNTGVIFASNHSSEWDPILVTGALSWMGRFTPLFYVSLSKEHYNSHGLRGKIYGGLFFEAWGAYPTYKGLRDYEKSLEHHISLLNSKRSLCYFPEGRVTKTGKLGEAKGGVAFLSKHTQTPIVPVGISGVYKISLADFFLRRRKVIIEFGEPIYLKNKTEAIAENYKKMSEDVMQKIDEIIIRHT